MDDDSAAITAVFHTFRHAIEALRSLELLSDASVSSPLAPRLGLLATGSSATEFRTWLSLKRRCRARTTAKSLLATGYDSFDCVPIVAAGTLSNSFAQATPTLENLPDALTWAGYDRSARNLYETVLRSGGVLIRVETDRGLSLRSDLRESLRRAGGMFAPTPTVPLS